MKKGAGAAVGMIGLGVMGRNLVLNLEDKGHSAAVWNLETEWTESFLQEEAKSRRITGTRSLEELARNLQRPRRIIMMIKAGPPVDKTLEALLPFLEEGDIVVDGGNSHFSDTIRRQDLCKKTHVHFVGMGVSGGEEGARHGPSLMPGGDRRAYEEGLHPLLESIAARSSAGPCVTYVGPGGAGHFVKMVHNGIEYGDMQLIAEAYDLLRRGLGMEPSQIADIFERWNEGPLSSFLLEISTRILRVEDEKTGQPLVEMILDHAGQKGTGKWTAQSALDLGIPIPTIAAAIDSRFLSALKGERTRAAKRLKGPSGGMDAEREKTLGQLESALYASKICCYAQGMALIRAASQEYDWGIDLAEICRIWMAGCIIRAQVLETFRDTFRSSSDLDNLLLDGDTGARVSDLQEDWRVLVSKAQMGGVPVLATAAGLAYFDAFRSARLPLNLTQAQRDYFGAHTYHRLDDPGGEAIHTEWDTELERQKRTGEREDS